MFTFENHSSSLSHLFVASPPKTMGQFAPEAIYASVQYCHEFELFPSFAESLTVFKDVPAKWIDVPLANFAKAIMSVGEIPDDFDSFEAYHAWYIGEGDTPTYPLENRWPSILSSFNDQVLEDGWHRMHAYVRAGHATIPVLAYDHDAWWQAHAKWLAHQPEPAPTKSPRP